MCILLLSCAADCSGDNITSDPPPQLPDVTGPFTRCLFEGSPPRQLYYTPFAADQAAAWVHAATEAATAQQVATENEAGESGHHPAGGSSSSCCCSYLPRFHAALGAAMVVQVLLHLKSSADNTHANAGSAKLSACSHHVVICPPPPAQEWTAAMHQVRPPQTSQ